MQSLDNNGVLTSWSIDREANLLTISSIFENWIFCTCKDIQYDPKLLQEIVCEEDIDRFNEHMDKLYAGQISSVEYRIHNSSNELKWVQCIGMPVLNQDHKVCRIDGVMLNITEQKAAREQLDNTISLYQKMFDTVDVAVWSYDTVSRKVLFISEAISKITGYSTEQAMDINFWSNIAHNEEASTIKNIIISAGQGIPSLSEYRMIHASGEIKWIQVRVIPSLDESQAVVRLDGIVAEITERKMMQEALQKNEQRYKSLFDYNSDIVCELDLHGNILAINPIANQITGELLNVPTDCLSVKNLFGVENTSCMKDYFKKTIDGDAQHYSVTSHHKDGKLYHWSMKNLPMYVNNRIVGVFIVAKDVTIEVEIAEKLAKREAEYRLITENMKDMMGVLDQHGNFVVASPSCEKALGIPLGVIKDTTILEYIHPDEQEALREQILEIFRTKSGQMLYNRFFHANGAIIHLESLATPVLDDDGEVENIVIVARDISIRVKIEAELRESEELNRLLIELSPEAVLLHSDYKFAYVNFSCLGLFGVSDESQLIGKSIFDWAHPDYLPLAKARMGEIYSKPNKILAAVEQKVVRADGTIIDVEVTASSILYKGEIACISIFRDIRNRKKLEEDRQNTERIIRESEERYFRLQMSLDQFSHDLFGVMKISHMKQRLLKEVRDILQITDISLIEMEDNSDKLCEIIETEKGYSLKIGEIKGRSYLLSINEKLSTLEISSIRVWLETITRYVSVLFDNFLLIEDLTKDLELAVSKHIAPTWFLRFMFKLSEDERKRLSQDLHDSVLQEQIIWYRKLDSLLNDPSIIGEVREPLVQVTEGLLDVIYQLRMMCNEIRPPALINEGLISSLETLFEITQLRTNYGIVFEAKAFNHKLNDDVLIGLYRIVQELLANAAKHSLATVVRFNLSSQTGSIQLKYEDNGVGMNLNLNLTEDVLKGMGIYGMKERVRSMDGTIQFHSTENKGLTVVISIPTNE